MIPTKGIQKLKTRKAIKIPRTTPNVLATFSGLAGLPHQSKPIRVNNWALVMGVQQKAIQNKPWVNISQQENKSCCRIEKSQFSERYGVSQQDFFSSNGPPSTGTYLKLAQRGFCGIGHLELLTILDAAFRNSHWSTKYENKEL
jgi:hypothetical protein